MAERIINIPERESGNAEALKEFGEKQKAEIERSLEKSKAERVDDKQLEKLKQAAERSAELEQKKAEKDVTPLERKRDTPAQRKAKAKANYKRTMKETQAHMKPAERTFSKVIHNPTVEKVSEVAGNTVARPNALLAGSVMAFLFTLAIYLVARHYGYPLSGAETIAAFAVGYAVGLLFDYLRLVVTGKKV